MYFFWMSEKVHLQNTQKLELKKRKKMCNCAHNMQNAHK